MRIVNKLAVAFAAALTIGIACAEAAPKNQTGIVSGGGVLAPAGRNPNGASQQATLPATAAPLTAQECQGLGGTVTFSMACAAKGVFACYTVDPARGHPLGVSQPIALLR